MKTNLLEELKVSGVQTAVTIKTLNGDYKHSAITVDCLEVANVDEKKREWIKLPRVFSQDDLPAASYEIATADNFQKWEYLRKIIPKMKNFDSQDVQLLIGENGLKALEPLEVITSDGDRPYAFRSRLGWCVVGPLSETRNENRFYCNKISVKDCITEKVSGHQFTVNCYKEDEIGALLKKLYTTDFAEKPIMLGNGINEKLSEVSVEDMSFLKIINQGCSRIGDLYVLPLPFRDTAAILPNNSCVAEKRLQSLKKKLQKDEKFHLDYKTFMNNLFEKGYARVCPTDTESNSSWYIPHHRVYHPNKPAKIRVVYDCSSEFQGRGLNK